MRFPDTDLAAIATAAGTQAITVRRVDDLAPVAAWAQRPDGPLVVDAKVDPDIGAEWLAGGLPLLGTSTPTRGEP